MEGQRKLVDAYLYYRNNFANPPRADILKAKRSAHNPMMDALIEMREEVGKSTDERQYMAENRLCNWIVAGRFESLDESVLSNEDAALLEQIRDRNRAFILAGLDYQDRKPRLIAFATRLRTKQIEASTNEKRPDAGGRRGIAKQGKRRLECDRPSGVIST